MIPALGSGHARLPFQERYRLSSDAFPPAGEAKALSDGAPHSDPVWLYSHRLRQPVLHRLSLGREARFLADDHCVNVDYLPPCAADQDGYRGEESQTVRARISGVGIGEVVANILQPRRPQDRIHDRVCQNVRVAMSFKSVVVAKTHSTQDQGAGRGEPMGVESKAHAEIGRRVTHPRRSARICSA